MKDEITPRCPVCHGVGGFLGPLGNLLWFRCEQCGGEFNVEGYDTPPSQYKVEILADSLGNWRSNGLKFDTYEDAETYAKDSLLVTEWRVVEVK